MDWTIGAFILGTLAVASVGWWSVGRYLARVLAGTEGGRGTAQRRRQPDQVQTQRRAPAGGWPPGVSLTHHERAVLRSLADAWDNWCLVRPVYAEDSQRMCDAIHEAQDVLALRVARRADPGVWRQPSRRMGKTADAPASDRSGDGTLGDTLAEIRDAGFARDLAELVNTGRLAIADIRDSPQAMWFAPCTPAAGEQDPQRSGCVARSGHVLDKITADTDRMMMGGQCMEHAATPAAKPSLTARDKMMITLTLMAVGPGRANGFLEAPCSWSTGDGKTVRGTRESMFAAMAATAPPPAAEPHLTTRELWLMTRIWNASRVINAPRSVGEWLREPTCSISAASASAIHRPRSAELASLAVRMFGEPGRTPEAS